MISLLSGRCLSFIVHFRKTQIQRRFLHSRSNVLNPSIRQSFDYNNKYFANTPITLQFEEMSQNRGLFAKTDIARHSAILRTPSYSHIVYREMQKHVCNHCHSILLLMNGEEKITSQYFPGSQFYCSEHCKHAAAPIDKLMLETSNLIRKNFKDTYDMHNDIMRHVLYVLAKLKLEKDAVLLASKTPNHALRYLENSDKIAQTTGVNMKEASNPFHIDLNIKRDELCFTDYYLLMCRPSESFSEKRMRELETFDLNLRKALAHTSLASTLMETSPLEIYFRDAANSFTISKHDIRKHSEQEGEKEEIEEILNDPSYGYWNRTPQNVPQNPSPQDLVGLDSGYAVFPIASYFNHDCTPNCEISFDRDMNLLVTTLQDIEAGEELTICYAAGEIRLPTGLEQDDELVVKYAKKCRKFTLKTWGFQCSCLD